MLAIHTKIKRREIPIINHFTVLSFMDNASIMTNKAIKKIIADEIIVTPASKVDPTFPTASCVFQNFFQVMSFLFKKIKKLTVNATSFIFFSSYVCNIKLHKCIIKTLLIKLCLPQKTHLFESQIHIDLQGRNRGASIVLTPRSFPGLL